MKIYLIGGKARHGKDTVADYLQSYYEEDGFKVARTQVSKYLKAYVKDYFNWDGSDESKPRELLQKLGTDVIRQEMNKPKFFIDRTIEDIGILSSFFDCLIISDIRYPEEFDDIVKRFPEQSVKIMINRVNFDGVLTPQEAVHKSETALDDYHDYDYLIINDSLKELKETVKQIYLKEKNNEEND